MSAHWPNTGASASAKALAEDGAFDSASQQFTPREIQQSLAASVEQTIENSGVLVAESGTGTGKTYAYLVPALLSGLRVIVSTGTKHLQDQLFNRDLPRVRKTLGLTTDVALLKGRNNYLCTWRLAEFEHSREFAYQKQLKSKWRQVSEWGAITSNGDISELGSLDESDPFWREVTSTADNCLGAECPQSKECYVNKARQRAIKAQLVVVNHHLFFSDLALKEQGFGELLPGHDVVIFDEAHQVPDVASVFFGFNFSSFQISDLLRDVQVAEAKEQSGADFMDVGRALKSALNKVDLAFSKFPKGESPEVVKNPAQLEALNELLDALADFETTLSQAAARGESLERCHQRILGVQNNLLQWVESGATQSTELIGWYESRRNNTRFTATPLSIADKMGPLLAKSTSAWVFTSATLAAGQDFSLFLNKIGTPQATTLQFDSPFDYAAKTRLYLPPNLPEPSSRQFVESMIEAVLPVLRANKGRAFWLFTSYAMLHQVEQKLRQLVDWPLFVHGQAPRGELIEQFTASNHGVLLGTSSFWEGVDIKGEALSCVIIDKLPFIPPNDPVMRSRSKAYDAAGGNSFMDLQVAEAIINLKQGAGRLIRDEDDRGVLVLCDARLRTKRYGKSFLQSLPPMPQTSSLSDIESFLR